MSEATAIAAESGCSFCKMVMHVLYGGEGIEQIGASGVYHFEPLNPVTPGHRLFIPAYHYEHAAEAPSATGTVFEWAAYWAAEQGEDFNLIVNAGPAASQTVRHLHVHYVPRRANDGLALPWTGQIATTDPEGSQHEEFTTMSNRIDHEAHAIEALASVPADVTPDQAIGVAQAAATLALVEQQRIANIIALGQYRIDPNGLSPFRHLVVEPLGDIDIAVHTEIREALGL